MFCAFVGLDNKLYKMQGIYIQGGSIMTGTDCGLFTHNQSRSYLSHLVYMSCYFTFQKNHILGKVMYFLWVIIYHFCT